MAAAAVGSCFSAAAVAPCRLSSHAHSDASIIRITPLRGARSLHLAELHVARRRRLPSVQAAVVQEGTAEEATAEQEGDVVPSIRAGVVQEGAAEEATAEQEGDVVPAPEPEPELVQSTKLYFGNLPYNCDSSQLAGIVQEYASPEMVEVLYDRDTGRSRGFAFVTMSSVEDCKAVIQNLDGCQYGGRTLRVNFSDKPKPKEPLYPESEYKLFVGNLSWSVKSESLLQVFQEYGNVVGARVLYDGDTGQSRGYGFVCYSTKQEMDAALETLNGTELEGRAMRISLALGKRS